MCGVQTLDTTCVTAMPVVTRSKADIMITFPQLSKLRPGNVR